MSSIEIQVASRWSPPEAQKRGAKPMQSAFTLRAQVPKTQRALTLPLLAPNSDIVKALKDAAKSDPRLSELADYVPKTMIELSQPARYASVLCNDTRKWTRRVALQDGMSVLMEGAGDSPALRNVVYKNGKVAMIREMKWVRTRSAWKIASISQSTPDGAVVQEISLRESGIARFDGNGIDESSQVATRVQCSPEELGARVSLTGRATPSVPRAMSQAKSEEVFLSASACSWSANCEDEYEDWTDALEDLGAAHTAVGLACGALAWSMYGGGLGFAVPPVGFFLSAGCLAAIGIEVLLFRRAERERNQYWACMRDKNINQSRVVNTPSSQAGGISLSVNDACDDWFDSGSGNGGATGGASDFVVFNCHGETWEISFDGGASWSPIDVTVCDMS
jgi:hypothetical protein